jgi:hypothetical protein
LALRIAFTLIGQALFVNDGLGFDSSENDFGGGASIYHSAQN